MPYCLRAIDHYIHVKIHVGKYCLSNWVCFFFVCNALYCHGSDMKHRTVLTQQKWMFGMDYADNNNC